MRAVHIEVVPKLDTDSCLNAIMRFIAQRGKPNAMISDKRTNFVGAEKEFAGYIEAWNKEGIKEYLIQRGLRWKFNPPAAPHFGEKLQESNVFSVGEQISHRGRYFNNYVFCRTDIELKTVDNSQFRR